MKHIKVWIKIFTLFVLSTLFLTSVHAVDLPLDNTISLEQGIACEVGAVYRAGTTATYGGQAIDLLIDITAEDNEYDQIDQTNGPCIGVVSGILETRLRDRDAGDDLAYMDLIITAVVQGTTTPLEVDRITFSGFDLDKNSAGSGQYVTDTDDVYMISPSRGYIEAGVSNVTYSEGVFGANYNIKLKGQTAGNCNDSATNRMQHVEVVVLQFMDPMDPIE